MNVCVSSTHRGQKALAPGARLMAGDAWLLTAGLSSPNRVLFEAHGVCFKFASLEVAVYFFLGIVSYRNQT